MMDHANVLQDDEHLRTSQVLMDLPDVIRNHGGTNFAFLFKMSDE